MGQQLVGICRHEHPVPGEGCFGPAGEIFLHVRRLAGVTEGELQLSRLAEIEMEDIDPEFLASPAHVNAGAPQRNVEPCVHQSAGDADELLAYVFRIALLGYVSAIEVIVMADEALLAHGAQHASVRRKQRIAPLGTEYLVQLAVEAHDPGLPVRVLPFGKLQLAALVEDVAFVDHLGELGGRLVARAGAAPEVSVALSCDGQPHAVRLYGEDVAAVEELPDVLCREPEVPNGAGTPTIDIAAGDARRHGLVIDLEDDPPEFRVARLDPALNGAPGKRFDVARRLGGDQRAVVTRHAESSLSAGGRSICAQAAIPQGIPGEGSSDSSS